MKRLLDNQSPSAALEGSHLDLGCGAKPKNPFHRKHLFGVDIKVPENTGDSVIFKQANLSLHPIPFDDNQFDSVSAFDFIEHIPRILPVPNGDGTRFPFIELMNEVWRILKPGGIFYAVTPAYPHPEAFQDPTHVNIITAKTHEYFCGEDPFGNIYGFQGSFNAVEVRWVHKKNAQSQAPRIKQKMREWHRRLVKGQKPAHLLWILSARK